MNTEMQQNPDFVEAAVIYLEDTGEKPATYLYEPPAGVPSRSGRTVKHPMAVRNGRPLLEQLTLDGQGFALVRHASRVSNFYDPGEVRSVYFPEVEQLVKAATGTARVLAFDHNVRCLPMAKRGENGAREPVKYAHNDYTLKSGPQRVRDLLPDDAAQLLRNRFVFINVWRPIRGPVEESPLAVCDAGSMSLKDFVATDLKYPDRTGEVYSITFNPNHRWFYFPRMQCDEALLLKCYDSAADGRARFTAHTAIEDPNSRPGATPRESIEVRTIALFPAAA